MTTDRSYCDSTRTDSPWRKRAVWLVLVFAVTGATVYVLGGRRTPQPGAPTATAAVFYSGSPAAPSDSAGGAPVPDAVIAEATNRSDGKAVDPGRIAAVRRNLKIVSAEGGRPGWVRTTIIYRGTTTEEALGVVNSLATRFAEHQRAAAAAPLRESYLQARASSEQARRELFAAQSELERFVRQHFEQSEPQNGEPALRDYPESSPRAPAAEGANVPSRDDSGRPPAAENPEWCDLRQQVARLKRQRTEMLLTRTPQHPAVKDLDAEIERWEQLLAGVPQYINRPTDGRPARQGVSPEIRLQPAQVGEQSPLRNHPMPPIDALAVADFAAKSAAVESARQNYEQRVAIERQACDRQLQLPSPEVRLAQQCEGASQPQTSRLLLVALAAALAMAAGLGMVLAGISRELVLSSPVDVQSAIAAPVVGIVSARGEATSLGRRRPTPQGPGTMMVVCGVAFVLISLGMAVIAVA